MLEQNWNIPVETYYIQYCKRKKTLWNGVSYMENLPKTTEKTWLNLFHFTIALRKIFDLSFVSLFKSFVQMVHKRDAIAQREFFFT